MSKVENILKKEIKRIIHEFCLFDDTSLIRRKLVDYRFLVRKKDGSVYTVSPDLHVPDDFEFFRKQK